MDPAALLAAMGFHIIQGGAGAGGHIDQANLLAALGGAALGGGGGGGGGWIFVDGSNPASIAAHLPSTTGGEVAHWIGVRGPPSGAGDADNADDEERLISDLCSILQASIAEVAAAGRRGGPAAPQATVDAMLARVSASTCSTGKWVCFVSREEVDRAWRDVARLTAAGALGGVAKVSTADPTAYPGARPPGHQLIIYTPDFEDATTVRRVLDTLVAAGVAPNPLWQAPVIGYKLDAWTLFESRLSPDASRAWETARWRTFRTLYQSDRPGGGGPAPGKRALPRVPGSQAAAARAVRSVLGRAPAVRGWEEEGEKGGAVAVAVAPPPPPGPPPAVRQRTVGSLAAGILAGAAAGGARRPAAAEVETIVLSSSSDEE